MNCVGVCVCVVGAFWVELCGVVVVGVVVVGDDIDKMCMSTSVTHANRATVRESNGSVPVH